MASIKCGHCKGTHSTVDEVRACGAAPVAESYSAKAARLDREARETAQEMRAELARQHRITVPTVCHSSYMAGNKHTVSCSCGWSEEAGGSENVLWRRSYRHLDEVRHAASAELAPIRW